MKEWKNDQQKTLSWFILPNADKKELSVTPWIKTYDDDVEEDEEPLMVPAASGDDPRYVRFFYSMRNLRVFLSFLSHLAQLREGESEKGTRYILFIMCWHL